MSSMLQHVGRVAIGALRRTNGRDVVLRRYQPCRRRRFSTRPWIFGTYRPATSIAINEVKDKLLQANPTLLQICTATLTGEVQWLGEDKGAKVQEKLASVMIEYWESGKAAVSPDCSPIFNQLVAQCDQAMPQDGFEKASSELTQLQLDYILDEMRGFPEPIHMNGDDLQPADNLESFHVCICGSGVHGISVALRCQRAGIPYTILERDTGVGGTWHQNNYPGVRCDTPSITYSFSSDPNPDWERYFADGHEVKTYLKNMCDKHGITEHCKTETVVESATWDEATSMWHIKYNSKDGVSKIMESNVYVAAVGQLTNPFIPSIPGQEIFDGDSCHTARFTKAIDFSGKNVVVVGTGASAMGICPEIQKVANHLTIFQGTPQWYVSIPNHQKYITEEEQWCMRYVPFYERWYRFQTLRHIVDTYTDVLTSGSDSNRTLQAELTEFIKKQVNYNAGLVEKMVPKHPPICTRMLVDNHWCAMMLQDNVTLINGRVAGIKANQVIGPNGEVAPADIIIYATGFQSTSFCTASMKVIGKGGVALEDDWGVEPTAYLGMTRPNFPNFFMTYGPNTNVSSGGSIIWCAETAGRYIGQCIAAMVRNDLKEMSVKPRVFEEYNEMITKELKWTAWDDQSCRSWYKQGNTGKVTNNLPMSLEEFSARTRIVTLADFNTKAR